MYFGFFHRFPGSWRPSGWQYSVAIHAALVLVMAQYEAPAQDLQQKNRVMKVRMIESQPKKPTPPPEKVEPKPVVKPEPKPEPKPEVAPKPKPKEKVPKRVIRKPRKVKKLPPKPVKTPAEKPKLPPKKKRAFSVSMEGIARGGGVAVPTIDGEGNVTGDASDPSLPLGKKGDGAGGTKEGTDSSSATQEPQDLDVVTRLPKLLRRPSQETLRKHYPKQAREEGREADVLLRVRISDKGRVVGVWVVRSGGKDFDKVAKKLIRSYRYRPAMRGSEAVVVEIEELFKFRLD